MRIFRIGHHRYIRPQLVERPGWTPSRFIVRECNFCGEETVIPAFLLMSLSLRQAACEESTHRGKWRLWKPFHDLPFPFYVDCLEQ